MNPSLLALLTGVKDYIAAQGGRDGHLPTVISDLNIVSSLEPKMPVQQVYRPVICVILQGAKELLFGEDMLTYQAMECLVVGMELPATGRIIKASPDEPYIGLTLEFDVATLREVLNQMDKPPAPAEHAGPGLFVEPVTPALADCLVRLLRLCDTPGAISILYPSIMREICYWMLSGPHGGELSKLALPGSNAERVVKAIAALHQRFDHPLTVRQLARVAQMSVPAFHQNFKLLTAMTPIQFQKQLRLLEARRLMISEAAKVSEAAYRVGYQSASQFSREYSRMFGVAPKQDVRNHKAV
ncbi:MAG: AraC family transcriptional regulator [Shinella sp.]|nr:AraC family transcriptional regulator [Shinella sp.]